MSKWIGHVHVPFQKTMESLGLPFNTNSVSTISRDNCASLWVLSVRTGEITWGSGMLTTVYIRSMPLAVPQPQYVHLQVWVCGSICLVDGFPLQAYYEPNKSRPNLTVKTGARVGRIIFSNPKNGEELLAQGAEYTENSVKVTVNARKEVIVCAGRFLYYYFDPSLIQ